MLPSRDVSRAQDNKLPPVSVTEEPVQWAEGPATRIQDEDGSPVDATFHVDITPEGGWSVVLESRGGAGDEARNVDYNRGLELLLRRLAQLGASIADAVVDSAVLRGRSLEERRLSLDVPYPLTLRGHYDLEALRRQLCAAQAKVGRAPGALGGGNRTKRLRLMLTFMAPPPASLAVVLAAPSRLPSWAGDPIPPAIEEPSFVSSVEVIPLEVATERVLKHLRTYGSLTEAEVTRMAGGPRSYRRLRRHFEGSGTALRLERTPHGMMWRLIKEHG